MIFGSNGMSKNCMRVMKTGGMKQMWENGFAKCAAIVLLGAFTFGATIGCGTTKTAKKKDDFFTSGSREADQRASQRMAKAEQLSGSGEGAGEKGVKKARKADSATGLAPTGTTNKAAQATEKMALFDRLGGEVGISNIVADFMPRALQDPR